MASYATPQNCLDRVDARRLGDLLLDDGTRVSPANILTNTRMLSVLADASGLIEAGLLRGGRYSVSDLSTLAVTTNNGNNLLIRICVDLAYGLLLEARAYSESEIGSMAPGYAKALAYLDRLSAGEWIFGTAPVIAASGVPPVVKLSTNVVLLTTAARRYFGDLDYQTDQTNRDQ